MKQRSSLILTTVAAGLTLFSSASHAVLISSAVNNPYSFSWAYDTGSSLLTGNGVLTLSGFNSSLLTVGVTLNNTSVNGGQGGDRLTSFGFGIDPNATGVTFVDVADGGLVAAGWATAPLTNIQGVEICAWGGVNCAGGSNGGIFAGASDSFSLLLNGSWGSSVNIDPIGLRYQTGCGSFTFSFTSTSGGETSTCTPTKVSEPSATGLLSLGLGLLAFGFIRRRGAQA